MLQENVIFQPRRIWFCATRDATPADELSTTPNSDRTQPMNSATDSKDRTTLLGAVLLGARNELEGLAVKPNYRRQGIGSELVRAVEQYHSQNRTKQLYCDVYATKSGEVQFYESLGWRMLEKQPPNTKKNGLIRFYSTFRSETQRK